MPDERRQIARGSSLFAAGDRVTIKGATHPWRGFSGVLVQPEPPFPMDWIVELDDSQRAGVNEKDITHV